ncbi:Ser/Thr protein phosphatase [Histomonas meleagridis]|uniref:Ser/Thr protein phosphatase n=1 Tax=Histomonas meleagridis TaxID=135588 RepID=UPI003559E7CA|nr:Ser/Thr protein phosphatase [Histomonas meleagridis]KAH0806817.1 Ser/Thr protein phosphatase [Histomonas meleagridis]
MEFEVLNDLVCQVLLSQNRAKIGFQYVIDSQHILRTLSFARKMFESEPPLLELNGQFVVVGDLHGNLDDILRIFQRCRYPPKTSYLFLGDYVDRGKYSVEVVVLLFALKIKFPDNIFLLRGNHETEQVSKSYGFFDECKAKYNEEVYAAFLDCFSWMPIAAIINQTIFCIHGGISSSLESIEQIKAIKRPLNSLPHLVSDLLWSDPSDTVQEFGPSDRKCGCLFGSTALNSFLENNSLKCLIRAHEFMYKGFEWHFGNCLTVFSSSNYQKTRNIAAYAIVNEDCQIKTEILAPLTEECIYKRRIIFPDWLLESQSRKGIDYIEPICNNKIVI